MSHKHQVQCHCGNITLSFNKYPESLTSCNCSICHRYAALWGYYQPDEVVVSSKTTSSKTYQWGDGYIDFHHCRQCGCVTHYTSTSLSPIQKVAINFRMDNPSQLANIPQRRFDGARSWTYLSE
ncbi:aldehyde-activating protein [Vibrio sp. ZSDZ34]|jgi:hypothetical protein|uniref:Aldehyde-activating protein n=1 Tax=Vibrio gelatinilyticus TaxID=2893468 RepID=A0A9X1W984_9VIBR|nr:aldehyde-activating protein [Vibrio gelatinilyticus]MCJ2376697.1 aldehyde-activating protein [Vibrio gelatinilyticus]